MTRAKDKKSRGRKIKSETNFNQHTKISFDDINFS